jgi:hypothetical protein
MKQTHHHFLMILAVAVTILVVAVFFYMKYSIGGMVANVVLDTNEAVRLQSNDILDAKLKQLQSASTSDWGKVYGAFVPVDNAVTFIEALESLGKSTGSVVTIASVDNVKSEEGSIAVNGYVNAKVNVQGSWNSVLSTLELAENLPYKVTIDSVSLTLSGGGAAGAKSQWTAFFNVNAVRSI